MPEAQKKKPAHWRWLFAWRRDRDSNSGTKKMSQLVAAALPLCHLSKVPSGQTLFASFGRAKIVKSFLVRRLVQKEFAFSRRTSYGTFQESRNSTTL